MPPKYGKRDLNEDLIKEALRAAGATVVSINMKAVPDLLVGFRGANFLLEVKGDKGELTPDQIDFFQTWEGHKAIVRTIEDALKEIKAID